MKRHRRSGRYQSKLSESKINTQKTTHWIILLVPIEWSWPTYHNRSARQARRHRQTPGHPRGKYGNDVQGQEREKAREGQRRKPAP